MKNDKTMRIYKPIFYERPEVAHVPSTWGNIPGVLKDIIERFGLGRELACEIGCEMGYSASALANYFKKVVAVDRFDWKKEDGRNRSIEEVRRILKKWNNIELIQDDCLNFIQYEKRRFDIVHIDVGYETHIYEITYPCAEWAAKWTDCILMHDTLVFEDVDRVCEEISELYGFEYWNYIEDRGLSGGNNCGLGILVKK